MKTSIVPAQVTSIEDTITGNLNLKQIILLVMPVFIFALVFVIIPPSMSVNLLKCVIAITMSLPFVVLSIRHRGVVLLDGVKIVISYWLRPHIYLLTHYAADDSKEDQIDGPQDSAEPTQSQTLIKKLNRLEPHEVIKLDQILTGKRVVYFSSKGVFNVTIEDQ